ncbi:hypothetical protein [Massilia sp. 9I]|uniref:hypothetical protein n=1 Tax=Massilia sp. 9I TaxID=2653152 RepID=UPI0012F2D74F|nr:hypothetical protein [Massilia sp. 9I]VXB36788.1 exported hypothetical protein [Massilia sp. 9I]
MSRREIGSGAAAALLLALALPAAADEVLRHSRDGASLRIDGPINAQSADIITRFIESGGKTIIIDSTGGDADAGMRIGESLAAADVEVVVDRYCFSSCANYVFVPARHKALNAGAVLGFHGGAPDTRQVRMEGMAPETRALFETMARLYLRQEALFGPLGVDTALFGGAGKLSGRTASKSGYRLDCGGVQRAYVSEQAAKRALAACMRAGKKYSFGTTSGLETTVYFPSRETLERHGVRGVGAYPYPANRAALRKLAAGMGFKIDLVADIP